MSPDTPDVHVPEDLPRPERPLGPEGLGLRIGEGVGELEEQGRGGWEPETWYEGPQVLLVSRYASPR